MDEQKVNSRPSVWLTLAGLAMVLQIVWLSWIINSQMQLQRKIHQIDRTVAEIQNAVGTEGSGEAGWSSTETQTQLNMITSRLSVMQSDLAQIKAQTQTAP